MKFIVNFKTPDALFYAIEDMSEDEKDDAKAVANRWMRHGEMIRVQFSTEDGTAVVLPP